MLSDEIETWTKEIEEEGKQDSEAMRLMTIPGICLIMSIALLGWIGEGQQFKKTGTPPLLLDWCQDKTVEVQESLVWNYQTW